jgi:type IV pilus assembly protein PilW
MLEVMLGLVLAPIVLAGIHSSFRAQLHALRGNNNAFELQDLARGALDFMIREVRMAGYDPSGNALVASPGPTCPGVGRGVTEATATRLHILSDLNGDGAINSAGEDVLYELDTTFDRILRTDTNGAVVVAENVPNDGLAFRYFDNGEPPAELVPTLTAGEQDCIGTVVLAVKLTAPNPDPNVTSTLIAEAASQVAIRSRTLGNL